MPRVRLRAPDTRSPEMLDPSTRINRSPSGAPRGPRGREPENFIYFSNRRARGLVLSRRARPAQRRCAAPSALPVLCPVLWGIGRRATATPTNLSICADRFSHAAGNVWQLATSISLLSRSGQARPSLVTPHWSLSPPVTGRAGWMQTFGGAPLAGSF